MEELEIYKRAIKRERAARKAAEQLLEEKAAELFDVNRQLQELNQNLEATVEERTEALSLANARLSTLVSNFNSGLLAENEQRHIILVNQLFCDIFGMEVPPQQLLGVDCSGFADRGKMMFREPGAFVERIDELLLGKQLVIGDQLDTADGRTLERDYIPIVEEGKYLGHLWQYRDVTDRVHAENELLEARRKAESAATARQQFLANMSHEIRTPMNSILGMSELLLKETLSERQRDFLDIIHDSAQHLLVVINDILDFSKVDSGKLKFEKIGFLVGEMARNLLATIQPRADEKGLELLLEADPDLPEVLIGDPYRLRQVLLNLMTNAVKFTSSGFVKLSIEALGQEAEGVGIRFKVKDSGVGISEDKKATIFEDFAQEDASVTRKFGGTGLGLTISAKLVRLMGGEIGVTSEPGEGSEFHFELTLREGNPSDLPSRSEITGHESSLEGLRLLLVEDHPFNQKLALAVMADWGIEIEVADNGQIALDLMEKKPFDVVLMDVQMPVMDGIEATRQIRLRYGAQPPVIALTANVLRSQEASLREGQMDGYLSKPFQANALRNEILRVLNKTGFHGEDEADQEEPTQLQGPLYNRAILEKQTGGNPLMTQRMLDIFVEMTPPIIADFQAAKEGRDLRKLENLAHKLKPSVRLMGMNTILNQTLELEKASEMGIGTERALQLADLLVAHLQATLEAVRAGD